MRSASTSMSGIHITTGAQAYSVDPTVVSLWSRLGFHQVRISRGALPVQPREPVRACEWADAGLVNL